MDPKSATPNRIQPVIVPANPEKPRLTRSKQFLNRCVTEKPCPNGPPYDPAFKFWQDDLYPVPDDDEVCIRTRAIGLNHIDWKNLEHQIMVKNWPEILGFEVAGVVEAVGKNVKKSEVRVGQAVMAVCGPVGIQLGKPPGRPPGKPPGKPGDGQKPGDDKKTATTHQGQQTKKGVATGTGKNEEEVELIQGRKGSEIKGEWIGRAGGFQDVTCVPKSWVTRMPTSWMFEWAAGVPLVYLTACSAIICGLRILLPLQTVLPKLAVTTPLESRPVPSYSAPVPSYSGGITPRAVRSVLVLGGTSGVGSSVIQLLRFALPKATIITTSSLPHHFQRLRERGANFCLRADLCGLVEKVLIATSQIGVDAIVDCIGGAACLEERRKMGTDFPDDWDEETEGEFVEEMLVKEMEGKIPEGVEAKGIWDAFKVEGPKLYVEVATGRKTEVPTNRGIIAKTVFSRMVLMEPSGAHVLEALPALIDAGKFKFPHPGGTRVVGMGLQSIPSALECLRQGAQAEKYVVKL